MRGSIHPTLVLCVAGAAVAAGVRPHDAAPAAPRRAALDTPVTYFAHVAPILFRECAVCHRPQGSAPFSVLDYEQVWRRAALIAELTRTRRMPPWLPEPGVVAFAGERRLDAAEIALLARWAAAGAPAGDPARAPPPPDVRSGWQLGEPDLVVRFPPYTVPAHGQDLYRNLVAAIPVTATRYVAAVEIQPGDARVVHHGRLRVDTTASSRALDARDPEPGFDGMELASDAQNPHGHFMGWTPGKVASYGPEDMAWLARPGTDLVLQVHVRPTGQPHTIVPIVGLHFANEPPTRQPALIVLSSKTVDIPAGAAAHVVTDTFRLPVPVEVLRVYPHAHYLGKTLEGFAVLPDGSRRWLIRIPDWDFNWQDEYRYAKPIALPAGAVLTMRWSFDNTAANPRNPNDPPRRVRYGPRSDDEMADLVLQVVPRSRDDLVALNRDLAWKDEIRTVSSLAFRAFAVAADALARGDTAVAERQLRESVLHRVSPEAHALMAAIVAARGDFAAAILHAERAESLARAAGDRATMRLMRERLSRYRRGRPE